LTQVLDFILDTTAIMGIGEWSKRIGFSGLTYKSMMHHYAIIPMIVLTPVTMVGVAFYVFRLATKHPEVSWTKGNPEPWQEYSNKQYKFLSSGRDYSIPSPAPKYK